MKKGLFGLITLVLAVSCWTGASLASGTVEVWGVDVINFGTYSAAIQQMEDITHSPGGRRRIVTKTRFLEETTRIPAVLGTRFGFRYVVNGIPKKEKVCIKVRKIYPGLKDPRNDNLLYSHEYIREHEIGEIYGTGYGFDHDWELVPGEWVFQLLYEGKILGEISFEVYKP